MGRHNSRQPRHGNPGGKSSRYIKNQRNRDLAKGRGHEARDEIEYVRQRARVLSGLHKRANEIVSNSRILTAINMSTSHMDVQEFCNHADSLAQRLFQLELQLAHSAQKSWRKDRRLECLVRALELKDRAGYAGDTSFNFTINPTAITIFVPGAQGSFALDENGLRICGEIMLIHERNCRQRRILSTVKDI